MRNSFGLAVILVVALSASASASPERLQEAIFLGVGSPCPGVPFVLVDGTVKIVVAVKSGTANVGFGVRASGSDAEGNGTHRVTFKGDGAFSPLSSSYSFPFDGAFAGKHGIPSFGVEGTVAVTVDETTGVPTGYSLNPINYVCSLP